MKVFEINNNMSNFLFSPETLDCAKSRDLLPLKCVTCGQTFKKTVKLIRESLLPNPPRRLKFCSRKCGDISQIKKTYFVCKVCDKECYCTPSQFKKYSNHFCSRSCSCIYSNIHRKSGIRRSKAEDYLIGLIKSEFPELTLIANERKYLPDGLEIDIFCPSIPLAIELNGPVHYFNIWGKLQIVQNRDLKKQQELQKLNTPLIILNISQFTSRKKCFEFLKKEFENNLKNVINTLQLN